MKALIDLAVSVLLESWTTAIKGWIVNAITEVISIFETSLITFFNEPLIADSITFGRWLAYGIFAASLVVLLCDLAEEAGSLKSEQFKVIEWPTIFTNLIKAILFIEGASRLSIIGIQIGAQLTGQLNPNGYFNGIAFGSGFWDVLMPPIVLIAAVGFCCITMMRIGAIFIQAFTPFLYVSDIVRGQTTAMGDWLRQTISILLTYFLQHVCFVQGLIFFMNKSYISCLIVWVTMFGVSKLLSKYGMSSGITGVLSSVGGVARGAAQTIGMFMPT